MVYRSFDFMNSNRIRIAHCKSKQKLMCDWKIITPNYKTYVVFMKNKCSL